MTGRMSDCEHLTSMTVAVAHECSNWEVANVVDTGNATFFHFPQDVAVQAVKSGHAIREIGLDVGVVLHGTFQPNRDRVHHTALRESQSKHQHLVLPSPIERHIICR